MSSAAISLVPVVSGSGPSAASPALSILSSSGAAGASADSLFFSLLSLQNMGLESAVPATDMMSSEQSFGESGFSFDPALLVLPTGLHQLSAEDLQSFISAHSDLLSNPDFLASLTPGTPQTPAAPVDPTAMPVISTDVLPVDVLPSAPELTISVTDAASSNPLLVASNLTPQDIETLKAALEKAAAIEKDLQHSFDDESTAAALALISLVPPPSPAPAVVDTAAATINDIPSSSSATASALTLAQSADTRTSSTLEDLALMMGADSDLPFLSDTNTLLSDVGYQVPATGYASTTDTLAGKKPLKSFEVSQLSALVELQAGASGESEGYQASLSADAAASSVSGSATDSALSSLDSKSLFLGDASDLFQKFDPSLSTSNFAGVATPVQSTLANPVLYNSAAASTHPATQTVASEIKTKLSGSGDEQTLSVQLDPPELGRVQIQISYEKGEPLRLHVVAEKKETLAILERDSDVLKTTLEQAGIQADTSSMSFDLASGDQQFDQFMQNSGQGRHQDSSSSFSLDGSLAGFDANGVLSTEVNWGGIDARGNVRYTMLV